MKRSTDTENKFKFEERSRPVGPPSQAPNLEDGFKIENHREAKLNFKGLLSEIGGNRVQLPRRNSLPQHSRIHPYGADHRNHHAESFGD